MAENYSMEIATRPLTKYVNWEMTFLHMKNSFDEFERMLRIMDQRPTQHHLAYTTVPFR